MARPTTTGPTLSVWHGQYKKSWKGILQAESFAHPAKFSLALIETIYDHCEEEGWLQPGSVVLDPFRWGRRVGRGQPSANVGYTQIAVELEQHFRDMATGLRLHRHQQGRLRPPLLAAGRACATPMATISARAVSPRSRRSPASDARPSVPFAPAAPRRAGQGRQHAAPWRFLPLPFPDRRDGYGPPPRAQSLFAQETASYARSSGVIPCTTAASLHGEYRGVGREGVYGGNVVEGRFEIPHEGPHRGGLEMLKPAICHGQMPGSMRGKREHEPIASMIDLRNAYGESRANSVPCPMDPSPPLWHRGRTWPCRVARMRRAFKMMAQHV